MNHRIIPRLARKVSEVGLGTWQIGGEWGTVDESTALRILAAAVDAGTTLFDTADIYGGGRSETLIGKFLRNRPAVELVIATKLGRSSDPGWPANFERAAVRAHTEGSLRRLGVGAIDLTQLHCVPAEVLRRGEIFEFLRELKREGKIRAFGASVESMEEALICLKQPDLASLQIIFNIFRQKPAEVLFGEAKMRNVALLVRLPLASGLLSGKMTQETRFAENDHRNFNRDGQRFNVGETFAGLPFAKGVELADQLKAWVPAGMTPAAMALRWCLDFDAVTAVIPGARSPEQAAANAQASSLPPLPAELHQKLVRFYHDQVASHIRGPS